MSFSPPSSQAPEELDLRSYLRPIWRRKFLILAIAIVAGAVVYFITSSQAKMYKASTNVYIQTPYPVVSSADAPSSGAVAPSTDQLGDVANLITSAFVQRLVQQRLGVAPSTLGSVSVTPSTISDFVTISTTSTSATGAARLANGFAKAYLGSRRQTLVAQADAAIRAAKNTLKHIGRTSTGERQSVLANLQAYEQTALDPTIGASQPSLALPPTGPYSPKPKTDTVFAVVLALVLGILLAYGLELLDNRIKGPDDIEELYGLPALAVLPRVRNASPFARDVPSLPDEFKESLRMIRYQLRLNPAGEAHKVILVTSGLQNEGKSTVVRDLSLTYAQADQRVLVVDCDVRKQSLAELYGVSPTRGFLDIFLEDVPLSEVVVPAATPYGDGSAIDLLVSGASGPESVNLLASPQFRDLLAEAKGTYDVILIDTAPLLMVADSAPLMPIVDTVLIVARLGLVTRQNVRRLAETLRRLDVTPAGIVVNGLAHRDADTYGYGYGDSYGAPKAARFSAPRSRGSEKSTSRQPAGSGSVTLARPEPPNAPTDPSPDAADLEVESGLDTETVERDADTEVSQSSDPS